MSEWSTTAASPWTKVSGRSSTQSPCPGKSSKSRILSGGLSGIFGLVGSCFSRFGHGCAKRSIFCPTWAARANAATMTAVKAIAAINNGRPPRRRPSRQPARCPERNQGRAQGPPAPCAAPPRLSKNSRPLSGIAADRAGRRPGADCAERSGPSRPKRLRRLPARPPRPFRDFSRRRRAL